MNLKKQSEVGEFFSYAVPAIISMLLSASIVIVDGIFIGHGVGHAGLASVNLTLPVFYVFFGIGIMIAVGGSIIASHDRGAGRMVEANIAFSNSLAILAIAVCILLFLLVLFFEPILGILKAENSLYKYTKDYFGAIRWFYPLSMISLGLSVFIRAEGKPGLSMIYGLAGNIINAIFDYLFIMRMGWGLRGAAFASGIAILVPLSLSISHFLSAESYFSFGIPHLEKKQTFEIFYNGSSEMISQLSIAFTTWLFNWIILRSLGINGLAAYTIVGYLIFIEGMVITGLATGLGPLVGFHYGAGNNSRILKLLKIALASSVIAGFIAWVIVIFTGDSIALMVSGGNQDIGIIAKSGYWLFTMAFLFNGFNVITSAFFTSLGKAKQSVVISSLRSLILNSLAVLILPSFYGDTGIWLSLPLAEILTLLVSQWLLFGCVKSLTNSFSSTLKKVS